LDGNQQLGQQPELSGWFTALRQDIIPRCLECHASYFEWIPGSIDRYRKTSLVLGITCERCHGPGREHAARHRLNSSLPAGTSESIVNPTLLTRDRQIDLYGLCHSGAGTPIVPSLTFLPVRQAVRLKADIDLTVKLTPYDPSQVAMTLTTEVRYILR
jgi:hypothetical protein